MENKLYPNVKQGILLLVIFVALQIAFLIPVIILESFFPGLKFLENLIPFLCMFIILLIGKSRNNLSFSRAYAIRSFHSAYYFPMLITLLGTGILVSELDNILQQFLPAPTWLKEFFAKGGLELLLLIVIVAPVIEEMLFRGLFLQGFMTHTSIKKAIFWSAFLFGIAHMNPWQFPGAVVAGCLFGWWVIITGSLLPGILGHAIHNGLPFVFMTANIMIPGYTAEGDFQPIWFTFLGLLLIISGIYFTKRVHANTGKFEASVIE